MDASDDEDRTVFLPGGSAPPAGMPSAAPTPPAYAPAAPVSAAPPASATGFRREGSGIQEGDVLNHIFEVRRFIARGGMGEVFEGANVNSDERVAIKVMLPALAADANIQAMFRKEARTLTRLSHPALVQYRVLAQEPQLGVLYIVTEFIDGANLADLLDTLRPDGDALIGLTRRLAAGLEVAHGLGAIHRDISPDNILLEDGRLDRAKVIDFGIAKDLDPSAKTVVGDGFAGKLGYVAPEQLGDFDRQVGPWTDVYSLGLVILAVATGRTPDLSGSFVDAINKRRAGPSLDGVPPVLLPVLRRMLAADPAERLRSMGEVLTALSAPVAPAAAAAAPATPPKAAAAAAKPVAAAKPAGSKTLVIGGAAAGGVALLGGLAWLAFGGGSAPPARTAAPSAIATAAPASLAQVLATIPCSWLEQTGTHGGVVSLAGAAGDPAAAQAAIARAITTGSSDFSEVAPISRDVCASLDAFRAIRDPGPVLLSAAQRKFEMSTLPADSSQKGVLGARVVLNLAIGDPSKPFALYGLEPDGEVQAIIGSRQDAAAILKSGPNSAFTDLGGDHYRFQVDVSHTGWSGFLLLTGTGGFPTPLVPTASGKRAPGWAAEFAQAAAANGWRAQMVWVKTVDELPN